MVAPSHAPVMPSSSSNAMNVMAHENHTQHDDGDGDDDIVENVIVGSDDETSSDRAATNNALHDLITSVMPRFAAAKSRRDSVLQKYCDEVITRSANDERNMEGKSLRISFLNAIMYALNSHNVKLNAIALTALNSLFGANTLVECCADLSAKHDIKGNEDERFAHQSVIEVLVSAAASLGRNTDDEHVQMMVLKTLKTACLHNDYAYDARQLRHIGDGSAVAPSPDSACYEYVLQSVNGQCLMLCIRSCYHIYLGCRDEHTITVAHGTLTDIQDSVMKKMEDAAHHIQRRQMELEKLVQSSLDPAPYQKTLPPQPVQSSPS